MDFFEKSVVVTGGAGFIGSHVVDALVAQGARVTVIDNLSTGFREFVSPKVSFVEGDLLDQALLDRTFAKQEFVFHFAANADVKDGLAHPRKDVQQNILATQNVLEAMRLNGVRQIAFSSTGSAYGESAVIPTPEDAPFPIQTSLYGASKVAAEGLLSAYAYGYGFDIWIYRFVSMLGPRYSHGHVIDFYRKLKRDPARLAVLGDGRQRKSYLHVSDCVAAIMLTIARSSPGADPRIYNIGHDDWIEVKESIRVICRELNVTPELNYSGGTRGWVGDSPRILLNTSKLRAIGWKPTQSIEAAIIDTLSFLRTSAFL